MESKTSKQIEYVRSLEDVINRLKEDDVLTNKERTVLEIALSKIRTGVVMDKAYSDGLEDAWNAAKEIITCAGFDAAAIFTVFPTPEKALAALRETRRKKESYTTPFKVGDEVMDQSNPDFKFYITKIEDELLYGIDSSGNIYSANYKMKTMVKTGTVHTEVDALLTLLGL